MKFGACGESEIGCLENEQSVFQSYKIKDKGGQNCDAPSVLHNAGGD